MVECKAPKGGSFKTLGLHAQLFYNVPFANPTPIQRKTIPLIMEGRSIMGIARTGSGKTLCYLLPAVQMAVDGRSTLVLLPTKELVLQVRRICKGLCHKVPLVGRIDITTLKEVRTAGVDMLVVDEVDRVHEEKSLATHFARISEDFAGQRVYFSATLPNAPLDIRTVQIENRIPEGIRHYFFYVPSESKEAALLSILDRGKKTIIFVATRYGADFLLEVLGRRGFDARAIYSSMDDDARRRNFDLFLSGRVGFLVVTDVAARGIDIPHLDVSVSFDLSDEKTFVHRVGRIRGMGAQYSLVTYSDVFHFFNIRETHLPGAEIGLVPQEVLDRHGVAGLDHLRAAAMRGYQRCLDFRRKVAVPSEFKALVDRFEVHSHYARRETLAAQLKRFHARPAEAAPAAEAPSFKDQFYIPYARKEQRTHSSAFSVHRDDYVRERKEKERRRPRRTRQRSS